MNFSGVIGYEYDTGVGVVIEETQHPQLDKKETTLKNNNQGVQDTTGGVILQLLKCNKVDEAYKKFESAYKNKIMGKCIDMLKHKADAEDAYQEIMTKIFLNINTFENKSKLSTWIYRITYNCCIDALRKKNRKNKIFSNDDIDLFCDTHQFFNEDSESEILENNIQRLENALSSGDVLSVVDRALMRDKYINGETIRKLATKLEISESAVKMRLTRAKQKIKRAKEK